MIIVFARQLNHLCHNTQSWHKKKLLHSDLWMPTFVQQDLWKVMSAAGIAATKRCFLLNGTYITETVPWAAPLRACGLPDAVFLAISATSACRDLHLEGEEGGGKRRFSSTALPPVPEVADSGSVNVSRLAHGTVERTLSNAWGFSEVVLDYVCPYSLLLTCEGRGAFSTPGSRQGCAKVLGPSKRGKRTDKPPSLFATSKPQLWRWCFRTAACCRTSADAAAKSPVPSPEMCLGATPSDDAERLVPA